MDLLPLLQSALLVFATCTILFLVVSFFIYKLKHRQQIFTNEKNGNASPATPHSSFNAQDNIVHTIAIPESGVLSNFYEEPIPVAAGSGFSQTRHTEHIRRNNYEVLNPTHEINKKMRLDPYTMFR
jgi:hypothetical protein